MSDNKLDTVIGASIAAIVGIVLICSAVIPVVIGQLSGLKDISGITSDQVSQYSSLIGIVVVMLIVGLIIAIIKTYQGNGSR